jgi:hypothetical protein
LCVSDALRKQLTSWKRADERRDLETLHAGATQQVDQAHLVVGADHLGLVLEAVPRADLTDRDTLRDHAQTL